MTWDAGRGFCLRNFISGKQKELREERDISHFFTFFVQLFSKFLLLEIVLIMTFSHKTVKEHIFPINSPCLEVPDRALNDLV